jgi:hypothetical protein
VIETETELRAKMLYYLGRAKNTLRRRGTFRQTAILYAASGITQWDMNIGDGRTMNRAQLENVVLCERPYCIFFVGDAWISMVTEDRPYAGPPSKDPDRKEVLLCGATLRHPHLELLVFLVYERDAKGRPVFAQPKWASATDPERQVITRWFSDIWSVLR